MSQDGEIQLQQARQKLPLRRLMAQYGLDVPPEGSPGKSFNCPICREKGKAATFISKDGVEFFKCFRPTCPSGTAGSRGAFEEVGFLAYQTGVSRRDAFVAYLTETGLFRASERVGVFPGAGSRKFQPPEMPESVNDVPDGDVLAAARGLEGVTEGAHSAPVPLQAAEGSPDGVPFEVVQQSAEDVAAAEAALAQAAAAVAEKPLEISVPRDPKAEAEAATVREENEAIRAKEREQEQASESDDERLIEQCVEIIRAERKASASLLQRRLKLGYARAARVLDELERRGVVGPNKGSGPRDVIGLPAAGGGPAVELQKGTFKSLDEVAVAAPAKSGGDGGKPPSDGGDGSGEEGSDGEEPNPKWRQALEAFYLKLQLTEDDILSVWRKRGLPREASLAYGLKSSGSHCREIIQELRATFDDGDLMDAGLLSIDAKTGELRPEPQFCGLGQTGRKKENGDPEYDWVNPILIPYLDMEGRIYSLRPHKGNPPGKPPRLYVARFVPGCERRRAELHESALITEGEFKAMAFHWATEGRMGAGAIPGISQAKNPIVREDYQSWLKLSRTAKVTIVFDSEDKSHIADESLRHETEAWGRFLAITLGNHGYDARFGVLPEEWRFGTKKADWDGAMARMVHDAGNSGSSDVIWSRVAKDVRTKFLEVLKRARPARELKQAGLLDSKVEKIIQNRLNQFFYSPQVPFGDDRERKIIRSLRRLARKEAYKDLPCRFEMQAMAEKFECVIGGYYVLHPVKDEKKLAKTLQARRAAIEAGDWDMKWWLDLKIAGIPEWITNFRLEPLYRLRSVDGESFITVELINKMGERTGRVDMPTKMFASSSDFREWIGAQKGGYVWNSNQTELDKLKLDVAHKLAFRDVVQVAVLGQDAGSGIWFFGDCAITPNGEVLRADKRDVYWHDGIGYKVMERGLQNQEFTQKQPLLHPGKWLGIDETGFVLTEAKEGHAVALMTLHSEMCTAFKDTIGGYDGWIIPGMMLSYGAASDVFDEHGAFPGLFVHGQRGSGKNTVVGWGMEIWGFHKIGGLSINAATVPGIQILAEQYANLPGWLDEFKQVDIAPEKLLIVKDSYNRLSKVMFSQRGVTRKMRTSLVISGESTMSDSATRQRFAHVQVSKERREGQFLPIMRDRRRFLFLIGREILTRRKEYVATFKKRFAEWMEMPSMAAEDDRLRMVHGVCYAGFAAFNDLVGQPISVADIDAFRSFLVQHNREAAEQSQQTVNVNQFLSDVVVAARNGVFGHKVEDLKQFFGVKSEFVHHPPGAPNQLGGGWRSCLLFIEPKAVVARMREYLTRQRGQVVLSTSDLKDQMSTKPWWHERNKETRPKWKFGGGSPIYAWIIDLDAFADMGYMPVSDEEWAKACLLPDGKWKHASEVEDPRKGELFWLVDKIAGFDQPLPGVPS